MIVPSHTMIYVLKRNNAFVWNLIKKKEPVKYQISKFNQVIRRDYGNPPYSPDKAEEDTGSSFGHGQLQSASRENAELVVCPEHQKQRC